MATPRVQAAPADSLEDLRVVRALLRTPKAGGEGAEADLEGVKELLATPAVEPSTTSKRKGREEEEEEEAEGRNKRARVEEEEATTSK